jgi:hypothetical protein
VSGKWRSFLYGGLLGLPCLGLATPPDAAFAQGVITQPRLMIYAGPLYRDFIGCLNCDQYDVNSVWDGYSPYGWDNVYSDYSHFYIYREPHGPYSACDAYAAHPPRIIDNQNRFYGYLNTSQTRTDSICGPHGAKMICTTLTAMCERESSVAQ